jgi:DNA-binding XRE family transcriptional regulator
MMSRPGQNKGIKNIKAKLSEQNVIDIFQCTGKTQESLASHYGVTQATINHIRKGRTWAWLTKTLETP